MNLNKNQFMHKYGLPSLLFGIQILDILVHAITYQLELVRVQSNIVILMWIGYTLIQTRIVSKALITTISISIYLIINMLFIVQYGLINPNNGQYRIALFIFVILTISLAFKYFVQIRNKR